MAKEIRREQALLYHSEGRPGKIEVVPTKEAKTQRDLSLAYSPGVAEPCKEIAANKEDAYKYTAKGNLVAVISNGTAVLGLGDIGPEASKPVMEGKGVLFKIFADIDVFDPETVRDHSSYEKGKVASKGVRYLLVNGTFVIRDGKLDPNATPGRPVRASLSAMASR